MKKGFTLIELLVVIAIIGILASVVLTSLNGARTKAKNVAFKSELKSIQPALINICDTRDIVVGDVPAAGVHSVGAVTGGTTDVACVTDGTFNVTFTPNPAITGGCTLGTVTDSQVTFAGC